MEDDAAEHAKKLAAAAAREPVNDADDEIVPLPHAERDDPEPKARRRYGIPRTTAWNKVTKHNQPRFFARLVKPKNIPFADGRTLEEQYEFLFNERLNVNNTALLPLAIDWADTWASEKRPAHDLRRYTLQPLTWARQVLAEECLRRPMHICEFWPERRALYAASDIDSVYSKHPAAQHPEHDDATRCPADFWTLVEAMEAQYIEFFTEILPRHFDIPVREVVVVDSSGYAPGKGWKISFHTKIDTDKPFANVYEVGVVMHCANVLLHSAEYRQRFPLLFNREGLASVRESQTVLDMCLYSKNHCLRAYGMTKKRDYTRKLIEPWQRGRVLTADEWTTSFFRALCVYVHPEGAKPTPLVWRVPDLNPWLSPHIPEKVWNAAERRIKQHCQAANVAQPAMTPLAAQPEMQARRRMSAGQTSTHTAMVVGDWTEPPAPPPLLNLWREDADCVLRCIRNWGEDRPTEPARFQYRRWHICAGGTKEGFLSWYKRSMPSLGADKIAKESTKWDYMVDRLGVISEKKRGWGLKSLRDEAVQFYPYLADEDARKRAFVASLTDNMNVLREVLAQHFESGAVRMHEVDGERAPLYSTAPGVQLGQAHTGVGKTHQVTQTLMQTMRDMWDEPDGRLTVLWLSTRIVYATELVEKTAKALEDAVSRGEITPELRAHLAPVCYKEQDEWVLLNAPSLVISIESLLHARGRPSNCILILDECETIASQVMSSTTLGREESILEALLEIASRAKKVFLCEAMVQRGTGLLLNAILDARAKVAEEEGELELEHTGGSETDAEEPAPRPRWSEIASRRGANLPLGEPNEIVINKYVKAAALGWRRCRISEGRMLNHIKRVLDGCYRPAGAVDPLGADKPGRVYIQCDGRRKALSIGAALKAWCAGLEIGYVVGAGKGETPSEEEKRRLHDLTSNPNEEWVKCHVIISNAKMTVGVSFNNPDYFDCRFMNVSCSLNGPLMRDSFQTVARARQTRTGITFYAITEPPKRMVERGGQKVLITVDPYDHQQAALGTLPPGVDGLMEFDKAYEHINGEWMETKKRITLLAQASLLARQLKVCQILERKAKSFCTVELFESMADENIGVLEPTLALDVEEEELPRPARANVWWHQHDALQPPLTAENTQLYRHRDRSERNDEHGPPLTAEDEQEDAERVLVSPAVDRQLLTRQVEFLLGFGRNMPATLTWQHPTGRVLRYPWVRFLFNVVLHREGEFTSWFRRCRLELQTPEQVVGQLTRRRTEVTVDEKLLDRYQSIQQCNTALGMKTSWHTKYYRISYRGCTNGEQVDDIAGAEMRADQKGWGVAVQQFADLAASIDMVAFRRVWSLPADTDPIRAIHKAYEMWSGVRWVPLVAQKRTRRRDELEETSVSYQVRESVGYVLRPPILPVHRMSPANDDFYAAWLEGRVDECPSDATHPWYPGLPIPFHNFLLRSGERKGAISYARAMPDFSRWLWFSSHPEFALLKC